MCVNIVCETRGRPFASLQYVSALPFLGFMPKEERTEEEGSIFLSSQLTLTPPPSCLSS